MATAFLGERSMGRILAGHPWVYASDIIRTEGKPEDGKEIEVRGPRGAGRRPDGHQYLGWQNGWSRGEGDARDLVADRGEGEPGRKSQGAPLIPDQYPCADRDEVEEANYIRIRKQYAAMAIGLA